MAKHYFSAGLNFQRGLIVTEMGEAFVNRWLIRAMTGHGSYLTRAFAPSMGVSPAEALELMRSKNISQLLVTDNNQYAGIIHLHDLIREGII